MDSTQQMLRDLSERVTAHISREDARDEERDKLFARLDAGMEQLKSEHVEMLRDWREQIEQRRHRRETWLRLRSSVAGWIVVGILGWIVATGATIAERAGVVWPWSVK